MARTIRLSTSDIGTYLVAPADQGQAIEVAYAIADGGVVRRTTDRSDGATTYAYASWDEVDTHGDVMPALNQAPTARRWLPCIVAVD